jgi:multidrug efflux pump subunit AcrB
MTCPKCRSSEIRASRSSRWSDIFQRVRGREAFRCRKCRQRFFASQSSALGSQQVVQSKHTHRHSRLMSRRTKKRLSRRLIVIAIFAVMFVIFLFFLRYLITERMPASDSGAVSSPLTCSSEQPA